MAQVWLHTACKPLKCSLGVWPAVFWYQGWLPFSCVQASDGLCWSKLQKLPRLLGWLVKLIIFNAVVIAIEWLVMTVLVPEVIGGVFLWILLILGNITFLLYDWMLPRLENLMVRIFPK